MKVQERISIQDLRGVDIFAGLADHELEQIAKICSRRSYHAGERCAIQGETADEIGIISEGKVSIEMRIEVAPYTQTLGIHTLTRGNLFAWSALVEPNVLTASARCISEVETIRIKTSDLQRLLRENPAIERIVMKNLATIISFRLRESWTQLTRLIAEMIKQGR